MPLELTLPEALEKKAEADKAIVALADQFNDNGEEWPDYCSMVAAITIGADWSRPLMNSTRAMGNACRGCTAR